MKCLIFIIKLITIAFLVNLVFDLTADLLRELCPKRRYFPVKPQGLPIGR